MPNIKTKKEYDEAMAKRKAIRKQYKLDGVAKFAKPKDAPRAARKMAKINPKVAKVFKNQGRKSLARKVVSKFGLAGKAAVGLSIGYDIIRGIKAQKQGSSCGKGHRTVKDGGQTFCISNAKIKKAKMKTTNRATPDIKSKR